MAEYEISLTGNQVKGLLTSDDGLKGLGTAFPPIFSHHL